MDRIGRYKIVRELGHGAMGVVYHAIDPNIGRPVAVKTIRLGEVSNAQERARLKERLFREARSAGILSHPGIVTIYDVDQQDDMAYIAMEYVDGPTLDELLSTPLGPEQLFSVLGQTSVALDYAHQKGIVHRDIKPANIMMDAGGSAKIADFGIAKITASEQFTMTGTIVGTPHYMSPEQVQGLAVDGRSDQFSLAVIAYEMLTGEKPFTGEQLTTVVYKIVAEEPPPAARLNATLSPQIEAALRKALSKKPETRYRTCQEFVHALESACAAARGWKTLPRGGSLNEPTLQEQARPTLPPPHPRAPATTTDYRDRRKVGFLPVFLAILMAAGLVALIAWQATPWLSSAGQSKSGEAARPEPAPAPAPESKAEEQKPSAVGPPAKPAEQEEVKPAAREAEPQTRPAETRPAETPAEPPPAPPRRPERRVPARPVLTVLTVISNPAGATAALDGRAEASCKTPCALEAAPGRHTVAVSAPGFMTEHREVEVSGGAYQVPLISLRAAGGTLMLNSVPAGAAISINGKPANQVTPAQISLAPGAYTIQVEKDGRRATDRVEIRNGSTTYRKIPLEP